MLACVRSYRCEVVGTAGEDIVALLREKNGGAGSHEAVSVLYFFWK
jgi:hypothetical protein